MDDQELELKFASSGLEAGRHALDFEVYAQASSGLPKIYYIHGGMTVDAAADLTTSEVVLDSSPVLGYHWSGLRIIARDSDGTRPREPVCLGASPLTPKNRALYQDLMNSREMQISVFYSRAPRRVQSR